MKDARLRKTLKNEIQNLFTDDSLGVSFSKEFCDL